VRVTRGQSSQRERKRKEGKLSLSTSKKKKRGKRSFPFLSKGLLLKGGEGEGPSAEERIKPEGKKKTTLPTVL